MPSLTLINPNVCPPNGFRYRFPEDGYVAHAWTYRDWIDAGLKHVQGNSMPIEELELRRRMEEQLCLTLDPGWCLYDDPNRPRVSTSLSWGDVAAGVKTFSSWIAKGAKYVPQSEADRRAAICSRCFFNVHIEGCSACQKIVQEITGDRKTKLDSSLRGCAVCKCLLKAKVHFPISSLDTESARVQQLYPEFCWLQRQGPNYKPNN